MSNQKSSSKYNPEEDDWTSLDLDNMDVPVPESKVFDLPEIENETANDSSLLRLPPFQPVDYGGNYGTSSMNPQNKIDMDWLSSLASSTLNPFELSLILLENQEKWIDTLTAACDSDQTNLDKCFKILIAVSSFPIHGILEEILKHTVSVTKFFEVFSLRAQSNTGLLQLCRQIKRLGNIGDDIRSKFNNVEAQLAQRAIGEKSDENTEMIPQLKDWERDRSCDLQPIPIIGQISDFPNYRKLHQQLLIENCIGPLREHMQAASDVRQLKIVRLSPSKNNSLLIIDHYQSEAYFGSLLIFSSTDQFKDLILGTVATFTSPDGRGLEFELLALENVYYNIFETDLFLLEFEVFFGPNYYICERLSRLSLECCPFASIIFELNKDDLYAAPSPEPSTLKNCSRLYPRQMDALTAGLSQRVTIIQGPPGTGKTTIGLKIIENLLEINPEDRIMIISVTNNALDELLSRLSKFYEQIIRFGTQSEKMDKYLSKHIGWTKNKRLVELFQSICDEFRSKMSYSNIENYLNQRRQFLDQINDMKQVSLYKRLGKRNVIGLTSAAASRNPVLLNLFKPRVLIVEEAAEMLECHLIASLTMSMEQMILIGDHHQLRATLNIPQLSTKYKFDCSLFERLILNDMPFIQLDQQSRMRPEMAELIDGTLYESYKSHSSTAFLHKTIRGMSSNLYFIDHSKDESKSDSSKSNKFESLYSLNLAKYLLRQGYKSHELVILTMYKGQLAQLEKDLKGFPEELAKVRMTSVDNFQGDESNIVILSLVRSNRNDVIGFVSNKNRICVALTRAKIGLYIIGNGVLLAKASDTWRDIIQKLRDRESIGRVLTLKCAQHQTTAPVTTLYEFTRIVNAADNCICK